MRLPRPLSLPCLLVLYMAPASAQTFVDHFSYPDGPAPGWTARLGTFAVRSGKLEMTSGMQVAYITRDGLSAKDCVLEGTFTFDNTIVPYGIQAGGLTSRHPGTAADAGMVLGKIQNNSRARLDFNRTFIYERPDTTYVVSSPLVTNPLVARLRLITLDNQATLLVDENLDGIFELDAGTRTLSQVLSAGLVGLTAYDSAGLDDFAFFDAVLVAMPGSVARPGQTYRMRLRAPRPAGTLFLCAASLRNTGLPVDTRSIPLAYDALFRMSLATPSVFAFVGTLDNNGDGFPALNLPNEPALVGLRMFVAGLTLDPAAPSAIANISNDHMLVVQP